MITRDFSVISIDITGVSLSLSLLLTKVTHAQYRKRFRASYSYFTLRPQLVQLYQEDPIFRTRLEEALDRVEEEVSRDYKMLVNETNRTYLSKYPFEEVARALGIQSSVRGFSASMNKLDTIKQHSLTIPGATQNFTGLQQLSETYTRTPESKYIDSSNILCEVCKTN